MKKDGVKHYRFVNNNDIVTLYFFNTFRHSGDLVYINHYGNIRKMTLWQRTKIGLEVAETLKKVNHLMVF